MRAVEPNLEKTNMSEARDVTAIDRQLGVRLRDRRLAIGMTQQELGARLGVTFQQVQKYEKGVNRIAASRLFDIASVLGVPIGRFFEGLSAPSLSGGRAEDGDLVERMLATPEGRELVALFSRVESRRVRRHIAGLTRAVAEDALGAEEASIR